MSSSSRRSDQHYNYPSFSSSLLEEIYRSFDEDSSERDLSSHRSDITNNTSSSYKKLRYNNKPSGNSTSRSSGFMERAKSDDKFRVNRFVLDQWVKDNNNQKVNNRRNSMPTTTVNSVAKFNSSSSTSSSDSSSGICGFSSDTDSLYGSSKSKTKPTLKPIKTTVDQPEFHRKSEIPTNNNKKNNNNDRNKEGNLQKRALKLYGDLKKVKQPISPGGKLATFLNSLFNSNASKKAKISTSSTSSSSSSSNAVKYSMTMSTPSTASSYSRSCLSKTPSSAGRFERRSVRFCPVVNTVMAYNDEREDEDEEEDHLRTKASKNDELKVQIMEKHRRVEEVAKELLKNYQYHGRKYQSDVNYNMMKKGNNNNNDIISSFEDEDEDEEDDASCCSSDLFELDNLLEIGGNHHQRYCEELPVYETTHLHTNRAIAKGFIL